MMRSSNFTNEKKRQILNERDLEGITVREICKRYRISIPTYYSWKRSLSGIEENHSVLIESNGSNQSVESENQILRRLYINLSAHNYELAKFLDK